MRKHTFFLAFSVALATLGSAAQARTVRVFVVGNSFSNNATRFLPQIVQNGGHELQIKHASLGGHSLQQHWSYVEAAEANPNDPKGRAYGGKSLRELLATGKWDFVTLQQYSLHSGDLETYRPYARKLHDFIKTLQPGAEIVMHQTWAYRGDAKGFGFVNTQAKKRAQDGREMWQASRAAYRTAAGELGIRVIPSGDAFWSVDSDPKWGYKPDATFDFERATAPALPDQIHSLHVGWNWKNPAKIGADYNHASDAGCYLAGLVWYGFLYGEPPTKINYAPPGLSADFAAYLRGQAQNTLQQP